MDGRNTFAELFSDADLKYVIHQMDKNSDEVYRDEIVKELEFRKQNGITVDESDWSKIRTFLKAVQQNELAKKSVPTTNS